MMSRTYLHWHKYIPCGPLATSIPRKYLRRLSPSGVLYAGESCLKGIYSAWLLTFRFCAFLCSSYFSLILQWLAVDLSFLPYFSVFVFSILFNYVIILIHYFIDIIVLSRWMQQMWCLQILYFDSLLFYFTNIA
jgi:hypothetical protein